MEYILNDSQVELFICLDFFYPVIEAIRGKTKVQTIISVNLSDMAKPDGWLPLQFRHAKTRIPNTLDFMDILSEQLPRVLDIKVDPKEDLALVLYTAGTTGTPKGVKETHYNMVYNCLSHSHLMGIDYDDVSLQIMPMFHTSGYFLLSHPLLYKGGTVVLVPLFEPGEFLKLIQNHRATVLFAPPTLFIALSQHPEVGKYSFTHFKLNVGCGAPVPTPLQKKWQELTGVELTNGWGMTETNSGGIISLPRKKNLESIGVPVAGEVKIVDQEGLTVPRGEYGEIMFRGPQVAKGYLNKPEETRQAFLDDGWFRTGDIGYISNDGFVYFVERGKDLIIASGYNISPFEVETVIMGHPSVKEVAVIGVPDPYRGETVKAFVVLREEDKGSVQPADIMDYCQDQIANYKRPRMVEFMDALPTSAVGKVLRRKLREYEQQKVSEVV